MFSKSAKIQILNARSTSLFDMSNIFKNNKKRPLKLWNVAVFFVIDIPNVFNVKISKFMGTISQKNKMDAVILIVTTQPRVEITIQ